MNTKRKKEFLCGYIQAALWSSTDYNGTPLDDCEHGEEKLARETRERMAKDCAKFIEENETDLDRYEVQRAIPVGAEYTAAACAGHDFWLTRERHGAGFWDRNLGELGERLTSASQACGESPLYVGDDGLIYQYE